MGSEPADRLISKLRKFAETLDERERALFATLLAPGVARAYGEADDVHGFGMEEWSGVPLPDALVDALRASGVRVVGLEDPPTQAGAP
jgi:hypothetical protein